MPSTLELKVEKPDKDDMHDDLSESKSDDESDKNLRTPRAGTRTRYHYALVKEHLGCSNSLVLTL